MVMSTIYLGRLAELPDPGGRGFSVDDGTHRYELFVVRRGNAVFGYCNKCPHTGLNLDWVPNAFMDPSGQLIQCATHGARFRMEDGYCVSGPCAGRSLRPLELLLIDGRIALKVASARQSCGERHDPLINTKRKFI